MSKGTSEATKKGKLEWGDIAKADANRRRGQGTGRLDRTLIRVAGMLVGCDENPIDAPNACLDPHDIRTLFETPAARSAVVAITKTRRLEEFLSDRFNDVLFFLKHNTGDIRVLNQTSTMIRMECQWTCTGTTKAMQMEIYQNMSPWLELIQYSEDLEREIPGPYLVFSFGNKPILIYAGIKSEKITVMRTMSDPNHTNWRPELDIRTYVELLRSHTVWQLQNQCTELDDPNRLDERLVISPWWPLFPFTD